MKQPLIKYREQFPSLGNKAYFNYGGQGPMPQRAMDGISQAQAYIQHIGPFGSQVGRWIGSQIQATKEAIALELNAPVSTITLTENVTMGCNIALWGIQWHAGDHILLSDCEHQGIIATIQEIGRRFGVTVSTCPLMVTLNSEEVIAQHLCPRTRLVVLSHILWNTGQVLPIDKIAELCRKNGTLLLVDAAQSVGVLPLNLTELGVDFYAFTGHKWLCGPGGVGGLYVRPEAQAGLIPTFIGWRGVELNSQGKPINWHPGGQRYEVGTSNYPLYVGLQEAIATLQQWGTPQERYEQICHLSQYLWHKLTALSGVKCLLSSPPQSGLVSFKLPNERPSKLVEFLESQGIFTRTILDPECIRVCVHYLTLAAEIERLVEAIDDFLASRI